jgi:hypothetical protein
MEIEEVDSPFLMQNIEANHYLDQYGRLLAGEIERWKTRATCWSCSTSAKKWC